MVISRLARPLVSGQVGNGRAGRDNRWQGGGKLIVFIGGEV
jgi:hypothetical protein